MNKVSTKKKIFIGSSSESKLIADAIFSQFEYSHDAKVWNFAFDASSITITEIIKKAKESDFAIMVLGEDDVLTSRGEVYSTARDNVILELGIFIGHLGLENCFIVIPSSAEHKVRIASDLSGVTLLKYNSGIDNPSESVLTACRSIEAAMKKSPENPAPKESVKVNNDLNFDGLRQELMRNNFEFERLKRESGILNSTVRSAFFSTIKPATDHEIERWMRGAQSNSGFTGRISKHNIYYTDKDVVVPPLYGADSIALIVESGTKVYISGSGHNDIYYMDGFRHTR